MSDQIAAMFRRRPNDGWFRAGRFDVTTTDIVCALAVASMFVYGTGVDNFYKLVFVPSLVREFEVWRIVTWPIATEPTVWSLLGVVFFWLFGQQLESPVRTRQVPRLGARVHDHPRADPDRARRAVGRASTTSPRSGWSIAVPRRHLGVRRHVPGRQLVRGGPVVGARGRVHDAQLPAVHGRRCRPAR